MTVVYICHPFAGDPKGNKKKVTDIVAGIASGAKAEYISNNDNDIITALSTFHAFPPSMEESGDKISRLLVMHHCLALLIKCDECWVYSKDGVTEGMKEEIEFCSKYGIRIIFKS